MKTERRQLFFFLGGNGQYSNLYFLFYVGIQLVYNVVLVSSVQQSESVICIFILFRLLSRIDYYIILSRIPCAVHQVLVDFLFYIYLCMCINPKLLIYPLPYVSCFGNHKSVFEVSESFCFANKFIFIIYFRFHI